MECGGQRSATPLWMVWSTAFRRNHEEIMPRLKAELRTKAPSPSLYRRTPNLRCETRKCWF
jgi:hypothetical protein